MEQGDSTVCDGENGHGNGNGKKVPALVTFNSDGSYIREQQ